MVLKVYCMASHTHTHIYIYIYMCVCVCVCVCDVTTTQILSHILRVPSNHSPCCCRTMKDMSVLKNGYPLIHSIRISLCEYIIKHRATVLLLCKKYMGTFWDKPCLQLESQRIGKNDLFRWSLKAWDIYITGHMIRFPHNKNTIHQIETMIAMFPHAFASKCHGYIVDIMSLS